MAKKVQNLPELNIFSEVDMSQHGGYLGRFDMIKDSDPMAKKPVGDTIHYKCIKCGECCRRGKSIELSIEELNYLAREHPEIKTLYAYEKGGSVRPFFHTGPKCSMLRNNECGIFRNQPFECRHYPFTLEEVTASTPDTIEFGKKYYKLYVYENCKGLGEGEPWSDRKKNSYINRLLREYTQHKGHLCNTYNKLTSEEFFRDHIQYDSGVIYGTEKEIEEFLKDLMEKVEEVKK